MNACPNLNIVNCEQRSPEWFAARDLKMTASRAHTIIGNDKKGGLTSYANELVFEYNLFQKYGVREEKYISWDMKRGIELEPEALSLYAFENGINITKVGFVIHDDFSGCSPDGLVGDDGGVECKCRNTVNHYNLLEGGEIPYSTIAQIQMCMLICKRKWWDYISYNPLFRANSLFQKRIYPDFDMFAKLGRGLKIGTELIKQLIAA